MQLLRSISVRSQAKTLEVVARGRCRGAIELATEELVCTLIALRVLHAHDGDVVLELDDAASWLWDLIRLVGVFVHPGWHLVLRHVRHERHRVTTRHEVGIASLLVPSGLFQSRRKRIGHWSADGLRQGRLCKLGQLDEALLLNVRARLQKVGNQVMVPWLQDVVKCSLGHEVSLGRELVSGGVHLAEDAALLPKGQLQACGKGQRSLST
mmetsp:Transcript_31606/g.57473  ORF Transcript_31606/g.57473 Transcript_31606/m.57473 type:complete len:210 (+) Transcript_31606:166-795(+)